MRLLRTFEGVAAPEWHMECGLNPMSVLAAENSWEIVRRSGSSVQIMEMTAVEIFSCPRLGKNENTPWLRIEKVRMKMRVRRCDDEIPMLASTPEGFGNHETGNREADRLLHSPADCVDPTRGAGALDRTQKTFKMRPTNPFTIAGIVIALMNWLIGEGKCVLQVHWPVPHQRTGSLWLSDLYPFMHG